MLTIAAVALAFDNGAADIPVERDQLVVDAGGGLELGRAHAGFERGEPWGVGGGQQGGGGALRFHGEGLGG